MLFTSFSQAWMARVLPLAFMLPKARNCAEAGASAHACAWNSDGWLGTCSGYMLGLTRSMMPLKSRSARTMSLNCLPSGWEEGFAPAKSATATRNFVVPMLVPVLNQAGFWILSWDAANRGE